MKDPLFKALGYSPGEEFEKMYSLVVPKYEPGKPTEYTTQSETISTLSFISNAVFEMDRLTQLFLTAELPNSDRPIEAYKIRVAMNMEIISGYNSLCQLTLMYNVSPMMIHSYISEACKSKKVFDNIFYPGSLSHTLFSYSNFILLHELNVRPYLQESVSVENITKHLDTTPGGSGISAGSLASVYHVMFAKSIIGEIIRPILNMAALYSTVGDKELTSVPSQIISEAVIAYTVLAKHLGFKEDSLVPLIRILNDNA